MDRRISPISWLTLRPQGRSVSPMIPIRSGEEFSLIPQALSMFHGVVLLTPILITCRGILLVHTLPNVASANIFFATGVISVYGASKIGFSSRVWTGTSPMVRHLNIFAPKILLVVRVTMSGPLLVWETGSRSLVRLPCTSLAVALFNSYLASFIVKLLIASTSLSDLSSL